MSDWKCLLELDAQRQVVGGSEVALADAIRRGADLRINTEFRHNEHLDVTSPNAELVCEVAEFGITYLIGNAWVAGIMNLRQPVNPPHGFGPRPSMSFFLYNQDGTQAIARPFLDGKPAKGMLDPSPHNEPANMPKYHALDSWDHDTNAPSSNFVYDFDVFRYFVRDRWEEFLVHDSEGRVQSGSLPSLIEAFQAGRAIKVGVRGVCGGPDDGGDAARDHELFVQTHSGYYASERAILSAGTHPLVRVQPRRPLAYKSGNWDFGWLFVNTEGRVTYRRCDPYTLAFEDIPLRCALRWFAA